MPVVADAATEEAQEFAIIAKAYEYSPSTITVKRGIPVKLFLTSIDRRHDTLIKGLDIKKEVHKGSLSVISFTPEEEGILHFRCAYYCGDGHGLMRGSIVVVGTKESEIE
jgi:heme/copper-type cytochrome/quinol oxidase subunit 2